MVLLYIPHGGGLLFSGLLCLGGAAPGGAAFSTNK